MPRNSYRTHARLRGLAENFADLQQEAEALVVGRSARVISNFNGQPHGRSHKPLTGQTLRISGVCLTEQGDVTLMTDDPRVNTGFLLTDVQLLERSPK